MRKYHHKTGSFYLEGFHDKIPSDAIAITDEQYMEGLSASLNGKQISVKEGKFVVEKISPISRIELLDIFKNELRPLRNSILAEVVQVALVAKALGNDALAAEVLKPEVGIRDRLRDITDDPALNSASTREEMELAVAAYYRSIVSGASPELRSAFKELEK